MPQGCRRAGVSLARCSATGRTSRASPGRFWPATAEPAGHVRTSSFPWASRYHPRWPVSVASVQRGRAARSHDLAARPLWLRFAQLDLQLVRGDVRLRVAGHVLGVDQVAVVPLAFGFYLTAY